MPQERAFEWKVAPKRVDEVVSLSPHGAIDHRDR